MNRRNFLAATGLILASPMVSLLKSEEPEEGVLTFESVILEFDKVNSNKRIYPGSLAHKIPKNPIGMAVTNKMPENTVIVKFSDMIGEVDSLYWRWFPKQIKHSNLSREYTNRIFTLHARVRFFKPQNVEGMVLRTFGVGGGKVDANGNYIVGDSFKLSGVALIPESTACTWKS